MPAALEQAIHLELGTGWRLGAHLYVSTLGSERTGHHAACSLQLANRGYPVPSDLQHEPELTRRHLREPRERAPHELVRRSARSIFSRWPACLAHGACRASWRLCCRRRCTSSCSAAAIGSRISGRSTASSYGRVHRARPADAVAPEPRASATRRSASTSRSFTGTIYEVLSAPDVGGRDRAWLRRSGGHEVESILGFIILVHGRDCSCRSTIAHPFWMVAFPRRDRRDVQPVRLHDRALGGQLREAYRWFRS